MDGRQLQENVDEVMKLIPEDDSRPWVPEAPLADNAAAAVAYAITCRQSGESQDAAWAARRAYEAVDQLIIANGDVDLNAAGAEEKVLSHPLIQAELARQRRDLDQLQTTNEERELVRVATDLRTRPRAESELMFKSKAK
jgi:Protein of unknown function (DUF416)